MWPLLRRSLLALADAPSVRKRVMDAGPTRRFSRRFVAGETVQDLVGAAQRSHQEGFAVSANLLGEAVRDPEQARRATGEYLELLAALKRESIDLNVSLKLTQLGMDESDQTLRQNLSMILTRARDTGTFLRFDMEASRYTARTLALFEEFWRRGTWDIGIVLQAALKRTPEDLRRLVDAGAPIRLCKGAYAEPRSIAHQSRDRVRAAFRELMRPLILEGSRPAIATHDEALLRSALALIEEAGLSPERVEFQFLHGVRRDLQREMRDRGHPVRVYIPYGTDWYPYLMRRLAERPENMRTMIHSVVKESLPGSAIRDPSSTPNESR